MAKLFSSVEAFLIMNIKHSIENNENSKDYKIDLANGVSVEESYTDLLFESFFLGNIGGKTSDGHRGKIILKLIGKNNLNADVTKEVTLNDIIILKYQENKKYVYKLDTSAMTPLTYNDNFYITSIELYYQGPIPNTTNFSDPVTIIKSDYPQKCQFAVDIPNSDPPLKGLFLDPTNPSSNIEVVFEFNIEVSK